MRSLCIRPICRERTYELIQRYVYLKCRLLAKLSEKENCQLSVRDNCLNRPDKYEDIGSLLPEEKLPAV